MAKRKLLFVEDHLVVYQGISRMLAREYQIIGPITDGDHVIDAVIESVPELILLDLELPNRHGTDILPELRDRFPDIPVLVLTVETSPEIMEHTIRLGAKGFVPKGADIKELRAAIEDLFAGHVHRSPRITHVPWRRGPHRHDQAIELFDERRQMVFRLIGQGRTTIEVAELIGATRWTVYYHRRAIRNLLRIDSDRGLDRAAMEWVMRQQAGKAGEEAQRGEPQ